MPTVRFTTHLQRFFPALEQGVQIEGATVADVVAGLNRRYPGFADYLITEHGALRQHVNIFIGDELIHDRERLSDALKADSRVFIFQALSGG